MAIASKGRLLAPKARVYYGMTGCSDTPFHSFTRPSSADEARTVPVTFHSRRHTVSSWPCSTAMHWLRNLRRSWIETGAVQFTAGRTALS
jgi:hypothetical protein